ncbi:MAG: tetraacyldisaccharide 4'-kinase [Pseudomonadota bacterium]
MKPPHFWSAGLDPKSREAAPLTRALLTPVEALYIWGFKRRWKKATPAPAPVPIICVGNVTVGGVGKTPIVALIRERVGEMGYRAASLSRGHGGRLKGPVKVDPAEHDAGDVGDEPLMLACSGESWIGRDRAAAATAMANAGVDVIVMDDGFQTPSVEKTLSFLVIDGEAGFGNGYCLPKGPMREPYNTANERADHSVITGDAKRLPEALLNGAFRTRLVPRAGAPDGPLVAFAGIGRPTKVFDSLKAAGADLRDGVGFGDHYVYKQSDIDFLRKLAKDHGARLITTEKDYVRLPEDWREGILAWPVTMDFGDDLERLDEVLQTAIETFNHEA